MQFEGKIYKIGLEWIGLEKSNGTITISIHFQNCNGYPVHSWTGWTDWTDQSKAGLVTNTLSNTNLKNSFSRFILTKVEKIWKIV